mmetsp:Transcript_58865/g.138400  ORF Transcript_58865/g.138400 Transcript_58865/m.138400 type:complete len:209 (-) Transcript_58865:253-879(-)
MRREEEVRWGGAQRLLLRGGGGGGGSRRWSSHRHSESHRGLGAGQHGWRRGGHARLGPVEDGRRVGDAGALGAAGAVVRRAHVVVELGPSSQRRGVRAVRVASWAPSLAGMHVRAALAPRDVDGVVAGRAFAGAVEVRAPRVVRLVPVRKHGVRACGHASLAGVENGRVFRDAGALRAANTVVRSLHVVVELRTSSQRRSVRSGVAAS